ncbi:hypothetical protein TWF730_001000 [Orbilia blumenaviensis]|uniref:DUF3074 domain-containing protein n=1 Tax=Orbilia blumenaviensis TaxID=1796055 RepID=A0AAV9VNC1_9PEZI
MSPIDLHQALQSLSPIDESSIPTDQSTLQLFLESTFTDAAYVVDTLPIPPVAPGLLNKLSLPTTSNSNSNSSTPSVSNSTTGTPVGGRSRSTTVNSTGSYNSSKRLTITPSSFRPKEPERPSVFTKDWKEVKPGGSNPHDIKVYKLSAKDGGGAWFARRSVHEGIGFKRFRRGLRREFEESLERRMGVGRESGEGMVIPAGVRGIGAEKRLERRVVRGVGRVDVYHLSAQFPGPSAPRDFVTACITSSSSAPSRTSNASTKSGRQGREFTMVSRPLSHPSAPEQYGFVRGKYESIEFIREIIPHEEGEQQEEEESAPRRSMSVSDLNQRASVLLSVEEEVASRQVGRKRSRTVGEPPRKAVSFDDTTPGGGGGGGGSLPRVGTFGSDPLKGHKASKLREAISADDIVDDDDEEEVNKKKKVLSADVAEQKVKREEEEGEDVDSLEGEEEDDGERNPVEWIMLTRSDPGGSVPRFMVERGTPGSIIKDAEKFLDWACEKVHEDDVSDDEHEPVEEVQEGEEIPDEDSFNTVSTGSTVEGGEVSGSHETAELVRAMSHDDSMSNLSFMTADSGECDEEEENSSLGSSQLNGTQFPHALLDEGTNGRARAGTAASSSSSSAALQRIQTDAIKNAAKTQTTRDKNDKKMAARLAKEEEKQRKLEEKHAREAAKREEKYKKEQARAEEKRRKEEEKIRDRRRRLEERDEKLRSEREKEDLKKEIEMLRKEKDVLGRENDALRKEVAGLRAKYELENGNPGLKSRSSSSMALHSHHGHVQRPASPASSSTSSKDKNRKKAAV